MTPRPRANHLRAASAGRRAAPSPERSETPAVGFHAEPGAQRIDARVSLLEYLHACPICDGADLDHYCRVPSLFNDGEFIRYERCRGCGTVLRNPRLPAAYRLNRYEERSFSAEEKQLHPTTQAHYWYMMRLIERLLSVSASRRLLDFGCGSGGFLVEAQSAGFEVMGLELSRAMAEHVESTYGIPVYQGLISDPALADKQFGVIVSSQVFEHLLDPRATLRELRRHLTHPGLVLIEVPNLFDIRERLRRGATMDDSHLFYFSRRSLQRLLADCGLRPVRVEEGLRPFRFLGSSARKVPLSLLSIAERVMSVCQIKTSISILAATAQWGV